MIEYKGRPLFGEGSSVSHTSEFFAIAGTVLFWLIFLIFSFVIKPQPKKKYKEVQIVLSSTPVVQKSEAASAPAEAASASAQSEPSPAQQVVETPPAQKSVEKPVEKSIESPKPKTPTQAKKEPAKKSVPKSKTDESVAYAKSNEELIAEQFNSKSTENKMNNFDKMFDDDEAEESQFEAQVNSVKTQSSMSEEVAGRLGESQQGVITSEKHANLDDNGSASENIKDKLQSIHKANQDGNAQSNFGNDEIKKTEATGSMNWTKGIGRKLKNKLDYNLSSAYELKDIITKKTPFIITFSVDSNGFVIRTTIEINGMGMLTPNVKNEMIEHISKLEFTSGEGNASAEFIWNINPL